MQFLIELKEVHLECNTHYELWFNHAFLVCCPRCNKWWIPCGSAMKQYKQKLCAEANL